MKHLTLTFVALAVALTSCTNSSQPTDNSQPTEQTEPTDSLNNTPLFADDGDIEKLYLAKGYKFDADIVKASRSGSQDAQFILAQMYTYGICGAKPDRRRAYALYRSLADQDVAAGQAMTGYMLFYGYGTDEDQEEGMRLIADACNKDYPLAYLFMGNIYFYSLEHTADNLQYAKVCYAKATAQNIPGAKEMLDKLSQ